MRNRSASTEVVRDDPRLERRWRRRFGSNRSVKLEKASTAKRGAKQGKRVSGLARCENTSGSSRQESGLHCNGLIDRSENDVNGVSYGDFQDLCGDTVLKFPTGIARSLSVTCFPASDVPETPEVAPVSSPNRDASRGKRLSQELSDLRKSNALKIGANSSSTEVHLSGTMLRRRTRNEREVGSGSPGDYDVLVKRRKASSAKKKTPWIDDAEEYLRLVQSFFRRNDVENEAEVYSQFLNPDCAVPVWDSDGSGEEMLEANPGANDRTVDVESHETDDVNPEENKEYRTFIGMASEDGIDGDEGNDNVDPEADMNYLNYLGMVDEDGILNLNDGACRADSVEEGMACEDGTRKLNGGSSRAANVEANDSDSDSDSDSVTVVSDHNPFLSGITTAFVDLESDGPASNLGMASHQFKEFTEILKRPYDAKQHVNYLQVVQRRTPVIIDRNLRGPLKLVESSTKMGKSYLDHHSDLAEAIDLAKVNKLKSLNLLRAFFFWVEKVPHMSVKDLMNYARF